MANRRRSDNIHSYGEAGERKKTQNVFLPLTHVRCSERRRRQRPPSFVWLACAPECVFVCTRTVYVAVATWHWSSHHPMRSEIAAKSFYVYRASERKNVSAGSSRFPACIHLPIWFSVCEQSSPVTNTEWASDCGRWFINQLFRIVVARQTCRINVLFHLVLACVCTCGWIRTYINFLGLPSRDDAHTNER